MYSMLIALAQEAEEHAEEQEAPNPIIPEWNEIIWGGLAFLILLVFMWKYAYPAIKKAMDARTERIQTQIDEADRARAEAEELKAQYEVQLAEARTEASRLIEEARQQAESVRQERIAAIDAEIAERRASAEADIAAARARALADLQSQVLDLAIGAAESVVEANLDRDANARIVESFIQRVGAGT